MQPFENYAGKFMCNFFINQYANEEVDIYAAFPTILDSNTALLTHLDEFHTYIPKIYTAKFLCKELSYMTISRIPLQAAHVVRQGYPFRNQLNIGSAQINRLT